MTIHHKESLEKLKRQRKRIRRKRWTWVGIALVSLMLIAVTASILTVGYWLPSAIRWIAPRLTKTQIRIGNLDCFPLGQLTAQQIICRNEGAKDSALAAERVRVTYSDFVKILQGRSQNVEISRLRVNNVEAVRFSENIRSLWVKGAKSKPLQQTLARWMPERIKLNGVNFITSANKDYYLKSLQTSCTLTAQDRVQLEVTLETGPLKDILPLQVSQPLQLSVLSAFTPDSFHLLNIKSNLGSLLQAEADEPQQLKQGEALALQMKDLRFDLNQWVDILDLPVAGTLEFDLHVPQWRFGRADQPQPWTGGLGPRALFSQMQMELQPLLWDDFHPGWSFAEGHQAINLDMAATPDFREGWVRADTKLQLKRLLMPNGAVDDVAIALRGRGGLRRDRILWNGALEALLPGANQPQTEKVRLRLAGETSGTLLLASSLLKTEFAITPQFERKDAAPFVVPMQGRLQYQKSNGSVAKRLDFSSTGDLAGGKFALDHGRSGASQSQSSTTLAIRNIQLEELEKGAHVFERNLPVHLRGRISSSLSAEQKTSEPLRIAGDARIRRFQPLRLDNTPLLKYPIGAQAIYSLSKAVKPKGQWLIPQLSLEADRQNIRMNTTGQIQKTENLLDVQLRPSIEINSLGRVMDLTSRTLGPVTMDGRFTTKGTVDWRQNQKIARIQYRGDANLSSMTAVNNTGNWNISGISGKAPFSVIWYQDMIRGTKDRPMAALEVSLAPTLLNINRASFAEKQYRWLEFMLGLHGRLFLNPETRGRKPARLLMLECDQIAAELPDIAKVQGDVEYEWRQRNAGDPYRRSGQVTFSAQVADPEGLAHFLQLPIGDAGMKGSVAMENGRFRFSDKITTCSGHLSVNSVSGEVPQKAAAWKDLHGLLDFALQKQVNSSTMTLHAVGEAKIGQLTVGGVRISDARVSANFEDQQGQADILRCRLLDGSAELASMINLQKWPPAVQATAQGYELDLATFTREFNPGEVLMEGKVDIKADFGLDENGEVKFEAQVTQATSEIRIDKNTVRQIVVEWASRTGMGFSMGAEELTLRQHYKNMEMIPFQEFEITCRYENKRFINRIVMRNEHFNIVIDNPIDLKVVTEFLRIKQQEIRGAGTF